MTAAPAQAGDLPMIGEIVPYAFTFCPRDWAHADGQLLSIAQNTALFSLYGTTYGGDGRTTFALPDLRGRVPMGQGTGPGLTTRQMGQRFGSETNTLSINQMPAHNHDPRMNVSTSDAISRNPINSYFAQSADNKFEAGTNVTGDQMAPGAISSSTVGGSQAVNNIAPTLVLRYCVALYGIFPSRN
ncbi:phage tail protein [Aurantiacibacter zhengii]|uniref:Phage tail protein n=2 Tax=Aurantiacibacter zhengii TaxID=2307003 RepID=A0A418NS55_9SPHN|nr:phage tail protein [Aurantiacibacter zhengii]